MFWTEVVEFINTHVLCSIIFFLKIVSFLDNVDKYGTARQKTDGDILRRLRFAYWETKAINTHSEFVILIGLQRGRWSHERDLTV